jgi:hypothetical protein
MKLETALKKPRTVPELVKLTKLSRGGVLAGLKRLKAKRAGFKANARGPKSALFTLRGPRKWSARATNPAVFEQATLIATNTDANGTPVDPVTDAIVSALADTNDPPPAL